MNYPQWQDDRTAAQQGTHSVIIAGRDKFMSRWGRGKTAGGSTAAWACTPENARAVIDWVDAREDMTHVRKTTESALARVRGLVHIYVVEENHPALV
tara:strand:- start:1253 stop:1543 length:291 start_codon:yes stop_codon:yes gene_type:complete